MKKFNLSIVALLAMSTFAVAGGDIAPVEPVIEAPIVMEETAGAFYLGFGYARLNSEGTETYNYGDNQIERYPFDDDFNELMFQAGYKFNDYVAVEGRYWFGSEETFNDNDGYGAYDVSVDAWGLYVKPMYPVTDAFDVYTLLGYGSAEAKGDSIDSDTKDGFSWGLGAAYSFTDHVAVFVDYVSIYDDEETYSSMVSEDMTIDTWNFGVTYQF